VSDRLRLRAPRVHPGVGGAAICALFLGLSAAGCSQAEDTDDLVLDDPVELPPPDISGLDMPAAFETGFGMLTAIDLRQPWQGHRDALALRRDGCPDIFAGNPNVEDIDIDGDDGSSWLDFCEQGDGTTFGGFEYWEISVNREGDPTSSTGRTTEASRLLFGDGVVGRGEEILFEFDGEATDGLTVTEAADDYYAWSYSSNMSGTVTGSLTFSGTETPGGYRVGLTRRAAGGVDQGLEANGNVYFFEHRIQDRFDSIAVNMELIGPQAAGPEDCTQEPQGYISLRDENAFWYDLVFSPRYEGDPDDPDYPNEPYSECDGCGTLYIRGLEQDEEIGEICVDLGFLWEGPLDPPNVQDFAFTLRDPGEDR